MSEILIGRGGVRIKVRGCGKRKHFPLFLRLEVAPQRFCHGCRWNHRSLMEYSLSTWFKSYCFAVQIHCCYWNMCPLFLQPPFNAVVPTVVFNHHKIKSTFLLLVFLFLHFVSYCFWFHLLHFSPTVFQSCSRNSRVICRTERFRLGFFMDGRVFRALGIKMFNP